MVWVQHQRLPEAIGRAIMVPDALQTGTAPVKSAHGIFASVESMRLRQLLFACQLLQGFLDVMLSQAHEPEEPVQPQGWVPIAAADLAIFDGRPLAQHRLGLAQLSSRDVDHRHLEVGKGEVRVQRQRSLAGTQTLGAPGCVAEPEQVAPIRWLERGRVTSRRQGFGRLPVTDQRKGQRRVRFPEAIVEVDRPPRVIQRRSQDLSCGAIARPRFFVRGQLRVRQAGVGEGIAGIDRDGALELADRAMNVPVVERFEIEPALGKGAIGGQAWRVAGWPI
jgi:hypothetical protein